MLTALIDHAEDTLPMESVSLLFGTYEQDDYTVSEAHNLPNIADSKTTFLVEPETQYRLMIDAESRNLTLVGIFHSHPAPPVPSETDLENMKLNPVVWIIASKQTGTWRYAAYLNKNNRIANVEIITT
jgi:proteasome lid subunit RPN8/RPN11